MNSPNSTETSPPVTLASLPAEAYRVPWLRQLFSRASFIYYSRSVVWVAILLLLVDSIPLSGVASFSALRSSILFTVLISILLTLKIYWADAYMKVCWFCGPGNIFLKSWLSFFIYVYLVQIPIAIAGIAPIFIFSWLVQCIFGTMLCCILIAVLMSGVLWMHKLVTASSASGEQQKEQDLATNNIELGDLAQGNNSTKGKNNVTVGIAGEFAVQAANVNYIPTAHPFFMQGFDLPRYSDGRYSLTPSGGTATAAVTSTSIEGQKTGGAKHASKKIHDEIAYGNYGNGNSVHPDQIRTSLVDYQEWANPTVVALRSSYAVQEMLSARPSVKAVTAITAADQSSSPIHATPNLSFDEYQAEPQHAPPVDQSWHAYLLGPSVCESFNAAVKGWIRYFVQLPRSTYDEIVATVKAFSEPCDLPFVPSMKDLFPFWALLSVLFALAAFTVANSEADNDADDVAASSALIGFQISTSVAVYLLSTAHRMTLIGYFPKPVHLILQPALMFALLEIVILSLAGGNDWTHGLRNYIVQTSFGDSVFAAGSNHGGDFIVMFLPTAIVALGFDTIDALLEFSYLIPVLMPSLAGQCVTLLLYNSLLSYILQTPQQLSVAMLTRNAAIPISIQIAEVTGASLPLTAASTIVAGLTIFMTGPAILDFCGFKDPITRGVSAALSGYMLGVVGLTENKELAAAGIGMCAFGFATIFFAVLMIIGGFKSFVVNPS